MEINLTLVSTKRTLIISMIWIILIQFLFFYSFTLQDFKLYLSISILVLGAIILYFLLKFFARFSETVEINKNFIRVGKNHTVFWDSIKSYEYSNTGLLVGFIFRTTNETIRIIGLTRGPEGGKFNLIKDHIFKILEERELSATKPQILLYNFYATTGARIAGFIIITIIIAVTIMISYMMISRHKISYKDILGLIVIFFSAFSIILRLYTNRKQNR